MAQGDNYQFGVAHEIKNHKFRRPTLFVSTIIEDPSTDTLRINNPLDNTNKIVQVGDKLNASNSSGQAENKTIIALEDFDETQTDIQVDSNFSLTYALLDPVIIKGTRLASGWVRDGSDGEDTLVNPLTIQPFGGGASDDYAQVLRTGAAQVTAKGIEQVLADLPAFRYYRIGLKWKADFDNFSGLLPTISIVLMNSGEFNIVDISSTDQFTWARFAQSSPTFIGKPVAGSNKIVIRIGFLNALDSVTYYIDDIFLEHAQGIEGASRVKKVINAGGGSYGITIFGEIGTAIDQFNVVAGDEIAVDDGTNFARLSVTSASGSVVQATIFTGTSSAIAADSRIQKKSDGFFTLTDTPVMESISYDKIRTDRFSQLSDGSLKNFDPMSEGHKGERWRFSCRFLGISQANFDGMQKLLRHQQNGSLISFHPFIDAMPHVLVGKLFITNYKKAYLFDLAVHDFTLRFEEMSI